MKKYSSKLNDSDATVSLGQQLAKCMSSGCVIYLQGNLGAGKTTLSRGVITGFGHQGAVKSPTYTLVEPYELTQKRVYHFDLYRLADPEELEFMGVRDYMEPENVLLVEWPEKGGDIIPDPDLLIELAYDGEQRQVYMQSFTPCGEHVLTQLSQQSTLSQ